MITELGVAEKQMTCKTEDAHVGQQGATNKRRGNRGSR
jgi:hypothetical protein